MDKHLGTKNYCRIDDLDECTPPPPRMEPDLLGQWTKTIEVGPLRPGGSTLMKWLQVDPGQAPMPGIDHYSSSWTRMDPALASGYCITYNERHNGVTGAATARDLQIQVEDTWDDSSSWEGTAYIPVQRG